MFTGKISGLPLEFLFDPFLFPSSAAFPLQSKCQESINSGPAHSDHRESISWHVLVPWPVPVPGSVCVPVALSRTGGNERALMLVPVTDAQHHHPPSSPPALSAFPSDTVRMGPCTDLQVAPLPGKSMSVELPRECEWSRLEVWLHSCTIAKAWKYDCCSQLIVLAT